MRKSISALKKLDSWLMTLCLIIMAASSMLQVLNRNIFKLPIAWTEEISRYSMIWMAMIGTSISVRKGMQMSVVLFEKRIKGKFLRGLDIFKNVMMLVFSAIVVSAAAILMQTQATAKQISPATKIPLQYISLAIFVGMLLIFVFALKKIIRLLRKPYAEDIK
jgi:TRAP-type C4-dicarboxylate transport system permease small subunit